MQKQIQPSIRTTVITALLLFNSYTYAAPTLTLVTNPNFGLILAGAGGRVFRLNANQTVTGADAADYVSGAVAGDIKVDDSTSPRSISIVVDNINPTGGLTVNQALCNYNGGGQLQCDGAGISATSASSAHLKLGLEISTNRAHTGGETSNVTMDVTVTYI